MAFLKFRLRAKNELEKGGRRRKRESGRDCPNCHRFLSEEVLSMRQFVCDCGYHFRMKARRRIQLLADSGSFREYFSELSAQDPLGFPGYAEKLEKARLLSGEEEGVVCGRAEIDGNPCFLFAMEGEFMMGSMGSVVGEKITRLMEEATKERLPLVGCTMSGGARMQEGLLSLMQMAKTAGALKIHSDAGLFSLMLLCNPTAGGVTASFAMGADITLAEPGATICFAGARVIEETLHKPLPKGFQTAEFLLEHGFLDEIVERGQEKELIGRLLRWHAGAAGIAFTEMRTEG
ncbi:acetyl-CoA carboxylase carboxyl transferase subunit beta [Oribacterium sp. oral taxon 102]|uniref:acetyl-CoA carboxylase carboxyltransferase subunit beta n=1 Tax=Oribacterium sp. oral taxon 102 TaxID=671214 RepID=UPI0015B9AB3B|nr:acetyl-CoA carboxylase carboxyltransferase subunit beta [Oribacterium sp. oral taxon 102]NWO20884.1 acetyl-CoA carboxylase carboxyl transferase subunit beta [Oribacterium sp. oral taxon 102]